MDIVQGHPALGLQGLKHGGNAGFAGGASRPRPFSTFCIVQLPPQFCSSFSS
ncbi:hypothetical protein [Pseudarthrobacter siccitolerans]|uniref:hypothetical protein n=1 Tax=Pseudarthrobacter siccitolerans TaxID=861266 RepID=UPI0027B89E14|nr:hypothetical protein [Pseudarthrobacter siccitolerans]